MNKLLQTFILLFLSLASYAQGPSGPGPDFLNAAFQTENSSEQPIETLIQLAAVKVYQAGEFSQDLDSANTYLKRARSLNNNKSQKISGQILLIEAAMLREKGEGVQGKKIADSAVASLKTSGQFFLLGQAYFEQSLFYFYKDVEQQANKINSLEQSIASFERSGNRERVAFMLKFLAELYAENDDQSHALPIAQRCLQTYQSIHYKWIHPAYDLIASIYFYKRDFNQALTYDLTAVKFAEANNDSTLQICQIYNRTGLILDMLNEKDKAISYYMAALTVAEKHHQYGDVYVLAGNIAHSFVKMERPEKALKVLEEVRKQIGMPSGDNENTYNFFRGYLMAYTNLQQFAKAATYCDTLLAMANRGKLENEIVFRIYSPVVKYYTASGQMKAANTNLGKARILAEKSNDPTTLAAFANLAFTVDTAAGRYDLAVGHLLTSKRINDSMFNENKIKQLQQLQVEFETAQKEKSIRLLKNEQKLKQRELAQSIQARNFFIAGVIMLLILLGVGYSRFRLKQRKNVELENKQTEIFEKNVKLQKLLNENDWLLREVHHRVKNNLQIVISLLNSQSAYLQDETALNAVMESQHRVQAMSLIHQKLYKSSNVSNIYMPEYVRDLTEYLEDSFKTRNKIYFQLDIQPIELDVLQAVPVGLILNEVITNSLKYAFPHTINDTIAIKFYYSSPGELCLLVTDNGRGFPAGFKPSDNNSFGLLLIRGLVEDLEGEIRISSENGTSVEILFKSNLDIASD